MGRLSGRTAIVTGGAKGIGRHYSLALAAEGARVMIADIADGKEIAEEIAAKHGAQFRDQRRSPTSATKARSRRWSPPPWSASARSTCWSTTRRCSRRCRRQKCTEIDVDLWDKVMAVNLRGPFLMVKHVAPHMIARGYGKIINIGSGTAYRGIPWMLHYVTCKGGMMAFTRALCARTRRARHPRQHAGAGLHAERHGDEREPGPCRDSPGPRGRSPRSLQRDQHPQDLLGALVFLASADSDFITGQTLAVDGGNVNT